jgi:polar amino acid transport system substrate-binding protein
MVEAVRLIFAKHGHRIDFKTSQWVNSIKDTRKNKVTALIGCSRGDAPDFIFPDRPLGQLINHYFVKKNSNWSYRGRQSLEGKRIGVISNYTYGDAVDNLVKTKHKSMVIFSGDNPLEQMLKKMEEGTLDAFVENPIVLSFYLGSHKIAADTFKSVSQNLANDPDLYIAFSPNNPKSAYYAELISKGITELRQSGELQRILERYNLSDWLKAQVVAALGVDDFGSQRFHGQFDLLDVLPARRL